MPVSTGGTAGGGGARSEATTGGGAEGDKPRSQTTLSSSHPAAVCHPPDLSERHRGAGDVSKSELWQMQFSRGPLSVYGNLQEAQAKGSAEDVDCDEEAQESYR